MQWRGTQRLVLGLCALWMACALCARGEEKTIDSCANRQQQNATFNEAGENTLHIRNLAAILEYACTVQVKSQNADQINTVVVHGDDVDLALSWLFNDKSLTVEARAGKTLQIVYAKVDRFVLEIGGTRNTVQFVAGALATETVLRFPAVALNATENVLSVVGGHQAVLATGALRRVTVGIPAPMLPSENGTLPFAHFASVLGLAGDVGALVFDTAHGTHSPAQHYVLGRACVYEAHRNASATTGASAWLQGLFRAAGLDYAPCSVVCNPAADQAVHIRTGGGADTVEADGTALTATLDLGDGADRVEWLRPARGNALVADLGAGADALVVRAAGPVRADLGDDALIDRVVVVYDGPSPSVLEHAVAPVGPHADSALQLAHWRADDILLVRRGDDTNTTNRIGEAVSVDAVVPGARIYYEQADNVTYTTLRCATDARIAFDAHSSADPARVAQNVWVRVAVAEAQAPCRVSVHSAPGANAAAALVVPRNAADLPDHVMLRRRPAPAFAGVAAVGRVELEVDAVDHVELVMPQAPRRAGTVAVRGVPARQDLLLVLPGPEWVADLESVGKNSTVAVVDGTTIVGSSVLDTASTGARSTTTAYSRNNNKIRSSTNGKNNDITNEIEIETGGTVLSLGSSGLSTLQIDVPNSTTNVQLVDGCVNTEGTVARSTLTAWMRGRLVHYAGALDAERACAVEGANLTALELRNVRRLDTNALRASTVRTVAVRGHPGPAPLTVALEPQPLGSATPKWRRCVLDTKDGLIHAEYGDDNNDENGSIGGDSSSQTKEDEFFDLYVHPGKGSSGLVRLETPMLAEDASLEVACHAGTAFYTWDFAALARHTNRSRVRIAAHSDTCAGAFENTVTAAQDVLPHTVIGPGIHVDLSVALAFESAEGAADEGALRTVELTAPKRAADGGVSAACRIAQGDVAHALLDATWDLNRTARITLNVSDAVQTTVRAAPNATDTAPLEILFRRQSRLSFPDNDRPVHFTGVTPSEFVFAKRTFVLKGNKGYQNDNSEESTTPSTTPTQGHCFDPCGDCTAGYWGEVRLSTRPCETRLGRAACWQRARVVLTPTDGVAGVGCGRADWERGANGTCAFVVNGEGAVPAATLPPRGLETAVIAVISASGLLTVTGFSSLLGRAVWAHRRVPGLTAWWARSVFRDLLADQFSWAGVVATAALAEARDFDAGRWGAPVAAVLQQAKHYVLDWFVPCDAATAAPAALTPAVAVFWGATSLSVVARLVFVLLERCNRGSRGEGSHEGHGNSSSDDSSEGLLNKGGSNKGNNRSNNDKGRTGLSTKLENTLLVLQALLTSAGFLLLPLVGYSLAFLDHSPVVRGVSLALGVLLFASQPVGSFTVRCAVGVASSLCVVLAPVALALVAGLGAPRPALLALAGVGVVALPAPATLVLWTAFFRGAVYRSALWRRCLAATVALRCLAAACGLAFLALLACDLAPAASTAATALWFAWIVLPWLAVVPLTVPVPTVLARQGNRRPANNEDAPDDPARRLVAKHVADYDDVIPLVRKGNVRRTAEFDGDDAL